MDRPPRDLDGRRTSRLTDAADASAFRYENRQHRRTNCYVPYPPRSQPESPTTVGDNSTFSEFHSSNQSINRSLPQRSVDNLSPRRRDGERSSQSADAAPRSRRSLLPDGWLEYSSVGKVIEGTRILCLKTPVDTAALYRKNPGLQEFGTDEFFREMEELKINIGMLVDLTFTKKYYQGEVVAARRKVKYLKIAVPGQAIPPEQQYLQFREEVDSFLANSPAGETVAVHCTHGVNRTGWFVCRYLMDRLNMSFEKARKAFATARGHDIFREYLIKDLENRDCRALLTSVRSISEGNTPLTS